MKSGTIISGFTTRQISVWDAKRIIDSIIADNDLTKVNAVIKLDVKIKAK